MTFDHDLSNMPEDEAKVWICLHIDSMRADILADDADHPGIYSPGETEDLRSCCEAAKRAAGRSFLGTRDN